MAAPPRSQILNSTTIATADTTHNDKTINGAYKNPAFFDANLAIYLAVLFSAIIFLVVLKAVITRIFRRCREDDTLIRPRSEQAQQRVVNIHRLVDLPGLRLAGAGEECAICLSELVDRERVHVLPKCHHVFHDKCVEVWLATRPSCPICRTSCLSPTRVLGADSGAGAGRDSGDEVVEETCVSNKRSLEPLQKQVQRVRPSWRFDAAKLNVFVIRLFSFPIIHSLFTVMFKRIVHDSENKDNISFLLLSPLPIISSESTAFLAF